MPETTPKTRRPLAALSLAALLAGPAAAQQQPAIGASGPQSYSASAVQIAPGQGETRGRILRSGQNLRLEYSIGGKQVIQILRPGDGVMYVLDPAARTYMEFHGAAVPRTVTDGYISPCPEGAGPETCRKVGTDTVSGIDVERWEITPAPGQKPIIVLWDSTRRRALRQEFPDGSVSAMAFQAMEEIDGRQAEHWVITVSAPGRETLHGDWWFDPALRLVLREDLPGGQSQRLEQIQLGPVDPKAFELPQGWQRIEPPAAGTPGAPQAPAAPPAPAPGGN